MEERTKKAVRPLYWAKPMASLAHNRRASHDYLFLKEYEAGLELTGPEVKSARQGGMKLVGSYVLIRNGEAWLMGAHISRYKPAGGREEDPDRTRKILLHKKEIAELAGKTADSGLTIVPIEAYSKAGLVKLRLALAQGRQQFEKRDKIRKREVDREIKRHLSLKRG